MKAPLFLALALAVVAEHSNARGVDGKWSCAPLKIGAQTFTAALGLKRDGNLFIHLETATSSQNLIMTAQGTWRDQDGNITHEINQVEFDDLDTDAAETDAWKEMLGDNIKSLTISKAKKGQSIHLGFLNRQTGCQKS